MLFFIPISTRTKLHPVSEVLRYENELRCKNVLRCENVSRSENILRYTNLLENVQDIAEFRLVEDVK